MFLVTDGRRRGYRHVLDAFWDHAKRARVPLPTDKPVSAAALCKARRKLTAVALRSLFRDVADAFERDHGARHRLHGRRVVAIDSTRMNLQNSPELRREFGGPPDAPCPQLTLHVLFDVVAQMPLDAVITAYECDERVQLVELTKSLRTGDLLLLDRGYPSYEVLELLQARGIDFVIRASITRTFPAVERFVASKALDRVLMLSRSHQSGFADSEPVRVRAVRDEGRDGHPRVFLTSVSRDRLSRGKVIALYKRRWEIELFFRVEKSGAFAHDQFHARTADGVRQEVFALLLHMALSRHLMASAARTRRVPYHEISQKSALLAVGRRFTELLLGEDPRNASALLDELLSAISSRLVKKRPGRSFPRRSLKPLSRWTRIGRSGGSRYGTIG